MATTFSSKVKWGLLGLALAAALVAGHFLFFRQAPTAHQTTYDFDFQSVDPLMKPLLEGYLSAYNYTVSSSDWAYRDIYTLSNFATVILVKEGATIKAAYMLLPPNTPYAGNDTDRFKTDGSAADGAVYLRLSEEPFIQALLNRLTGGGSFGRYRAKGADYLYFVLDPARYAGADSFTIAQDVSFFAHEGFHLFPQEGFDTPTSLAQDIRFNLPDDYPADEVSFSLISAGVKLAEQVMAEDDPAKLLDLLKMQYVLFKKLLELDSSGKNYVRDYYLFQCWLEGGAEFAGKEIIKGAGLYGPISKFSDSYENFQAAIRRDVEEGNTNTNINGVEQLSRYDTAVDSSSYTLGYSTLAILEKLGVDSMSQLAEGLNPYEMLEAYVIDHTVDIDEAETFETLKSLVDWDAQKELMRTYINLWE